MVLQYFGIVTTYRSDACHEMLRSARDKLLSSKIKSDL